MKRRLSYCVALLALALVVTWGAVAGCSRTTDPAQPATTVETQEVSLPPTAEVATMTPTAPVPATVTPTPVMAPPTRAATATPEFATPAATPPAVTTPKRPALTATPAPRGQWEIPSAWQLETRSSPELASQYPLTDLYTADEIAYFKEIAFEDDLRGMALFFPAATEAMYKEDVADKKGIEKWGSGQVVKYAVGGGVSASDMAEIHSVIARLDALIPVLDFRPVEEPSDASLVIWVATYDEVRREMKLDADVARWRTTPYASFGTVENFVVVKSSVLINADQPPEIRRRSIIKGPAASLGLAGSSWWYPDSTFYQGGSASSGLAEIDEAVIRLLYDPRIKPGMTIEDLERIGL